MFRTDLKITDVISTEAFTISTEVIPPRNGAIATKIMGQIGDLCQAGSAFLSVTKGAGGSLRAGSLPIAQAIKDHFEKPSIAHFTCRDLSPVDVENQLLDHHYFGIRNILALRGDPPRGLPDWTPRADSYPHAFQLMEQISRLNQGEYLDRKDFKVKPEASTDFCIGATCYPDDSEYEARIGHFQKKVHAGAEYAISQMIFCPESYAKFIDECAKAKLNIPVLPGTRILRSKEQAQRMGERFGAHIPKGLINKLPSEKDDCSDLEIIEVTKDLIEGFKKAGAPGVHLFVLQDTDLVCSLLKSLGGGELREPLAHALIP